MYNAFESLQAFELGTGQRKERERETAMKGIGNAFASGDISGATSQAFKFDPMLGMQIQQYGDQRNALATRQSIGTKLGAKDFEGGMAEAFGAGELDMGAQIMSMMTQMDQQSREKFAFSIQESASVAGTLLEYKTPEERKQKLMSDPMLQRRLEMAGIPLDQAINAPMDDASLNGQMKMAMTAGEMLQDKRWQAGFDREGQYRQEDVDWRESQAAEEARRFGLNYGLDARGVAAAEAKAAAEEASEGSGLNPALAGLPSGVQSAIVTKELGTLEDSEANVGQARKAANLARTFMAESEGYGALGGGPLADIGQAASQKTASLKGVTAEMIPMMRQPGEGIMTDADAKRYESAVVSINKGRKANQRVVDDLERFEKNEADRDAFLRAWQQQNGYGSVNQAKQVWMEYANANPIFDAETGKVNESRPDIFTWLNGDGDIGGATGLEDAAEEDLFYILRGE